MVPSKNWLAWGLVQLMLNLVSSLAWGVRLKPWTGAGGPTSFTLIFRSMADPSHPGGSVSLLSRCMSWLPTSRIRYSLSLLWSFGSLKSGTEANRRGMWPPRLSPGGGAMVAWEAVLAARDRPRSGV